MSNISDKLPGSEITDNVLDKFAVEAKQAEKRAAAGKTVSGTVGTEKAHKPVSAAIRTAKDYSGKSAKPSGKNGVKSNASYRGKNEKPYDADAEKRRKAAFWIIIGVTAVVLLVSIIFAVVLRKDKKPNPDTNNVDGVAMYDPTKVFSDLTFNVPDGVTYPEGIQEKYKALYAANQNFVGWLSVPNTTIDTAVYQADDNDYYLKKDLWGSYSRYGTVFLDYCDNISAMRRNTVIYGHNFDDDGDSEYDDIIFGDVHKYLDVEFYKTAPVIEFNTLYKDYKWKVVACYYTNGDSTGDNDYLFYYIATGMNNDNFMSFMQETYERSYIKTSVDVVPTDKILTLSTCTYFFDRGGSLQNARCVLVARMVRDGESEEVDTSSATQNEKPRYPQMYYDVFGGENPYRNGSKWYPAE